MNYRPDIDGLRALAVMSVIFHHAGIAGFSGGYLGVDIFFAISGYLITGILYREIGAGTFSLATFYERRFRRLLPALFLVCAVCLIFGWFWMMPRDFRELGQSLVATTLFLSNIFFFFKQDYFASAAELKPLLHTWSLSVEEQYYILFPLLILWLGVQSRVRLCVVIAGLALSSMLFAGWASINAVSANFYLLPSRVFQIGAGALLFAVTQGKAHSSKSFNRIASMLGLGLLIVSIFLFDKQTATPGPVTLLPLTGVVLLLACARQDTEVGMLLSLAPVVLIGQISYSAYLWHQPIFAFARLRLLDPPEGPMIAGLIVLTLVLAWMSWRFVETPFRDRHYLARATVFRVSFLASALAVAIGGAIHVSGGAPGRVPASVLQAAEGTQDRSPHRSKCHVKPTISFEPDSACVLGESPLARIVVWGDSHGDSIAWRLAEPASGAPLTVRQLTFSLCPPVPGLGFKQVRHTKCNATNQRVREYLAQKSDIETVILVARWPHYLEQEAFDNAEGGREKSNDLTAIALENKGNELSEAERRNSVAKLYRNTVEVLLQAGKTVVLVYPVPEIGWNVPHRAAKLRLYSRSAEAKVSVSHMVYKSRAAHAKAIFDTLPEHENLIKIRPERILCDTWMPDRCAAEKDGNLLYYDDDHLSATGADLIVYEIKRRLSLLQVDGP